VMPVSKLQIWVDLPTLYNKILLFDENNRPIELDIDKNGKQEVNQISYMRRLLEILSFNIGDYKEVDNIKYHFLVNVKDVQGYDLSNLVHEFFLKYIVEESRTVRLLKAINHIVLAPPYIALKNRFLASELPIKDVPGTWKVSVFFGNKQVVVTHFKKARSTDSNDSFDFGWTLSIVLNRGIDVVKDVSLYLSNCTVSADMNEEKKKEFNKILKELNPSNMKETLSISTKMLVLSPEEAETFKKEQREKYEKQQEEAKQVREI